MTLRLRSIQDNLPLDTYARTKAEVEGESRGKQTAYFGILPVKAPIRCTEIPSERRTMGTELYRHYFDTGPSSFIICMSHVA